MHDLPLLPGAEPLSFRGSSDGVLVIHGFTGSPQSMRPISEACMTLGCSVEMPLLPGHGTSVNEMKKTNWGYWSSHVEKTYLELSQHCERVFVVGLSMGGTLALWLASLYPKISGLVAINSSARPSPKMLKAVNEMLSSGVTEIDGVGNDIAKPGVVELAYEKTPLEPLRSLLKAEAQIDLSLINCQTIIYYSEQDHVVPKDTSPYIAKRLGGSNLLVPLLNSYHVATLDFDSEIIINGVLSMISS